MNQRHLILTMLHRLQAEKVAPFFLSLRRTGFSGDVVLFASAIGKNSISQLADWGAHVREFSFHGKHVGNRLARLWPIWKLAFASPIPEPIKRQLAHGILHLFYRRHLLYLDFLQQVGNRYSRIFVTDSRDVFFQADPFAWPQGPGLHVFLEANSNKIGECSHHVRWIKSQFGEETLERLRHATVSCAGTVFGDPAGLRDYLERMISLTMRARSLSEADGDQGLHNYLIYTAPPPQITVHANGEGPIATVGFMRMADLRFNSDRSLLNETGHVPPIIHQYDRIPELREMLLGRIRDTD